MSAVSNRRFALMRWATRRLLGPAILAALLLSAVPGASRAAEVWLAGVDPLVRAVMKPPGQSDYMQLFQDPASWSRAVHEVKVFKTSTQFLERASDAQLAQMFTFLKQHDIALGFEALMLSWNDRCGIGVEGYSKPTSMAEIAARIRRLGGDLRYVAMDEPLLFGHYYDGVRACRSNVADIAKDAAVKAAAIRLVFPEVQIGDTEPVGSRDQPNWVDDVMQWAAAYQQAAGRSLDFFQADVQWNGPWQAQVRSLRARLRSAGIKFGIIYNGNPNDSTGEAWVAHAEARFTEIEADPSLMPDEAIVQTWMLQPAHYLPDTDPGSLTYLVTRYAAKPTVLTIARQGQGLSGQLATTSGEPVGGASLRVSAVDSGRIGIITVRTLIGRVPAQAVEASIGVRLDVECGCSADANVSIGMTRFREDVGSAAIAEQFLVPRAGDRPADNGAPNETHLVSDAAHPVMVNTRRFAVKPDGEYTLQVPMQATPASKNGGYIAVMFFDGGGKEVLRQSIPFEPGVEAVGTANTDNSGRFVITPAANLVNLGAGFRVDFAGNDGYRATSAELASR